MELVVGCFPALLERFIKCVIQKDENHRDFVEIADINVY